MSSPSEIVTDFLYDGIAKMVLELADIPCWAMFVLTVLYKTKMVFGEIQRSGISTRLLRTDENNGK